MPYPRGRVHGAAAVPTSRDVPREHARTCPPSSSGATPYLARADLVDRLRSPRCATAIVTLGDHDDERLVDDSGRLLDAQPPADRGQPSTGSSACRGATRCCGSSCQLDPRRPQAPTAACAAADWRDRRVGARSPDLAAVAAARPVPRAAGSPRAGCRQLGPLAEFTLEDLRVAGERLAAADALLGQGAALAQLPGGLAQPPAPARDPVPARARRARARRGAHARRGDPRARSDAPGRAPQPLRHRPDRRRGRSPRDPAARRRGADVRASRTCRSGASRSPPIARSRTWACGTRASRRA